MEATDHSDTLVITHETTRCNRPGQPPDNIKLHLLVFSLFKNAFSDSRAIRNAGSAEPADMD
jgi:hypothetical protein